MKDVNLSPWFALSPFRGILLTVYMVEITYIYMLLYQNLFISSLISLLYIFKNVMSFKNNQSKKNAKNGKKNSGNTANKPIMRGGRATPVARPPGPTVHPLIARYGKQIADPFSQSALGCRVPDAYSFPTSTYHLHGNIGLASTATGAFGALFLPCPVLSLLDMMQENGGSSCIATSGMTAMGSNPRCYQATNGATLSGLLANVRIASWGIKISNLMPELSATGKLFVTLLPTAGATVPAEDLILNTGVDNGTITHLVTGMNAAIVNSSALEAQPTCVVLSIADLLQGDVQIAGSYTAPAFFNLKSTNTSGAMASGVVLGNQVEVAPGGTVFRTMLTETTNMLGGVGIMIRGEGFPANVNTLMVEYIYHLEGTPSPTVSVTTPCPSGNGGLTVGTQQVVELAMERVSGMKSINWISRGTNFLNRIVDTGMKAARSPLGRAAIGLMGL
jgi:hypothetical protein